jgi:hypothetical protein
MLRKCTLLFKFQKKKVIKKKMTIRLMPKKSLNCVTVNKRSFLSLIFYFLLYIVISITNSKNENINIKRIISYYY